MKKERSQIEKETVEISDFIPREVHVGNLTVTVVR